MIAKPRYLLMTVCAPTMITVKWHFLSPLSFINLHRHLVLVIFLVAHLQQFLLMCLLQCRAIYHHRCQVTSHLQYQATCLLPYLVINHPLFPVISLHRSPVTTLQTCQPCRPSYSVSNMADTLVYRYLDSMEY